MQFDKNTTLMDISESQGKEIRYGDLMLITGFGKTLSIVAQIDGKTGVEYQLLDIPDGNRWNGKNILHMTTSQATKTLKRDYKVRLLTKKEKEAFHKVIENFINTLA